MSDDDAVTETGPTFRLMYRSRSLIPAADRKVELGELFSAARSNNKKRHVCGALLVTGDSFVQVLEGDESTVRKLYARISHDPRHESVTLVETGPVHEPVFARWAMAEVSAEGEPDIPLIAHQDGISPASSRGTTPDQEEILNVMRGVARDQVAAD